MENVGIFMFIGNILLQFGIHILWPFGNVVVSWYIFPRFGILCQEKSGNPDA
jgi:Na+/H+-dicarboxylate symporter